MLCLVSLINTILCHCERQQRTFFYCFLLHLDNESLNRKLMWLDRKINFELTFRFGLKIFYSIVSFGRPICWTCSTIYIIFIYFRLWSALSNEYEACSMIGQLPSPHFSSVRSSLRPFSGRFVLSWSLWCRLRVAILDHVRWWRMITQLPFHEHIWPFLLIDYF